MLTKILDGPTVAKVVGVYDGLTALVASRYPFDALWLSGLGVSAALGLPDASIASSSDFLAAARTVCRATHLPVVVDADTGFGDVNTVLHVMAEYERARVAAVCIEDKAFPKRNSFTDGQELADPAQFAATLQAASACRGPRSPLLIARVESLVAGAGLDDALDRATLYVRAGADAVLVHSRASEPDEVLAFGRRFRRADRRTPLVAVPTTYPHVRQQLLHESGYRAVIYANHLLRGFVSTADRLLEELAGSDDAGHLERRLEPVSAVLNLMGSDAVTAHDRTHRRRSEENRSWVQSRSKTSEMEPMP
ncbi:isocitrate lyase/phosphoenolpyruvate mutase family protein [Kribbella steppae]|uniref:isocitrate lyase/phosphoenolpyruvate mutase family protein n=1 Tax=Kribbella steppae TaxID=2512223 RepID=UPI00130E1F98|nr:isocitrate lyase/phosphoenolpyruvate mutase family protein [Kribbella steppae]